MQPVLGARVAPWSFVDLRIRRFSSRNTTTFWVALAALHVTVGVAHAAQRALTEREAVALAISNNPELQALEQEIEVSRAKLAGASVLLQSNPDLDASVGARDPAAGSKPEWRVGLTQSFEIAGKRGARISSADAVVAANLERLSARRAEIVADVRQSFARLQAAEQRTKLADEAQKQAGDGLAAANERFKVGASSLLELNSARVEIGRAARDQRLARQQQAATAGEFALLLALEPGDDVAPAGALSVASTSVPAVESLIQQAMDGRADLKAAALDVVGAEREVDLADREAIPDLRVGAAYAREEGAQIIQGTIGIGLPLFNRNQAGKGSAAARLRQARIAREALARRVVQEVRLAATRFEAARSTADLYGADVLRALEENLGLAIEAYKAGKVDFLQLVLVRRETLEARRAYIDTLEELTAARAQLDRVLGRMP